VLTHLRCLCYLLYCVTASRCRWQAVSATLEVLISAGKHANSVLQDVVVQGFDMAFNDTVLDSVLSASAAAEVERHASGTLSPEGSEHAQAGGHSLKRKGAATTISIEPYLIASSLNMHLRQAEVEGQSKPSVIVARGIKINDRFTTASASQQASTLCVMLVLDSVMLLLATFLFLAPLEKVSVRVLRITARYSLQQH
jgi:hypothetical protein